MDEKIAIARVEEKLDAMTDANRNEHAQILVQVTRTNGRVSSLENDKLEFIKWQNRLIGGWIVIMVIVIPVVITLIKNYYD